MTDVISQAPLAAIHPLVEKTDLHAQRQDRKSTRLNSSHSLHDALPILTLRRYDTPFSMHDGRNQPGTTRRYPSPRRKNRSACATSRSEEHTSELQSLPTRRSSDLDVAQVRYPFLHA